jgi:hypothetical protein
MVEARGKLAQQMIEASLAKGTLTSGAGDIKRYYFRSSCKSEHFDVSDNEWLRIYGNDCAHALPAWRPRESK